MGDDDKNRRVVRSVGNYPAHVIYKKVDYLDLKKGETIFSLEPKDYEIIMFLGNFEKNAAYETEEQIKDYLESMPKYIVFDREHPELLGFKGCVFPFRAVTSIATSAKNATNFAKYILTRGDGIKRLYYNYGSNVFDYYGTGITDLKMAWDVVCEVCRIKTHCMLVKTKYINII